MLAYIIEIMSFLFHLDQLSIGCHFLQQVLFDIVSTQML